MSRHSGEVGGANKESKGNISAQCSGNGRRRRTGSRNIKEVTFTDCMEQKKLEGDGWDDSKIEDEKKCESRGALPARRGRAPFRGSLQYVKEDTEADMDDLDDNSSAESGGSRLPARRLPSSATAREPIRLIHSDTSTSSASYQSGIHRESVNIMDFGIDHHRRPFTESISSFGVSSTKSPATSDDNMSNLVDSCGFLGWDNDSHSFLSIRSNYGPVFKMRAPKGSESYDSISSSLLSNLVDSTGFLAWGSQLGDSSSQYLTGSILAAEAIEDENDKEESDAMGFLGWGSQLSDSSSQDLTASIIAAAAIVDENAKEESDVKDKKEDSSEKLCESWRIEDYEYPNDMIDLPKRSGSGNILARHMKRLSSKVSESMIISAERNSWNVSADADNEAVKTNDIKRIFFQRHPSSDGPMSNGNKTNINTADRPRLGHGPSFKSLFGGKRRSSDASASGPEDEYYSRPAIRINREDDVDIGELRRELCVAGSNKGNTKDRLKMGFF